MHPPNLPFPNPHTIRQLTAFLAVIGFFRIQIPKYVVPEQTPLDAPPNIPIWVLDNVWPPISLSVVGGLLKLSREQHFTVVLLANAHPKPMFLLSYS
jgi:hypothetical protein